MMVTNYSKQFAAWATGWWEKCASKFLAAKEHASNRLLKTIFAREILQSQKRFISDVAHELRTPLSVIKTSTEVALIDPSLSKDTRATFAEILGELERVSEILNNLLSLNALGRPEQMLFKSLDVAAVADVVVARFRPLARERNLRIRLRAKAGSLAWANASAVEQILSGIIKNALLYTPKGGEAVVVSVYPDIPPLTTPEREPGVVITVEDHGVGIAQSDLAHIFEPFYRADLSRTRLVTKTGSGLGLTIANELVRAQGGSIEIDSKRSRGTTVLVRLPLGGSVRDNSSALQRTPATLSNMQEETVIWSPVRAAVTFLRGW